MTRISFRLLLIFFFFAILLYDGVESKRGGGSRSGGSGRGSSGSRSSSSGRSSSGSSGGWGGGSKSSGSSGSKSSWGSGSSSRSSSSSSSNWGSSSRSSSGGGSYSKPSYGSSGRGWGNRYNGNTYVVMRTHTYYRGGGYGGSVYSSRSGSSAVPSTPIQQSQQSESPTVTTETIRGVLFPGGKPSKEIFHVDESVFRLEFDSDGEPTNFLAMAKQVLDPTISDKNQTITTVPVPDISSPTTLVPEMKQPNNDGARKIVKDLFVDMEALKLIPPEDRRREITRMLENTKQNFMKAIQNETVVRKKRGDEEVKEFARKYKEGRMDEVVHIKEEEQPVLVGLIPYFWGDENLPKGDNETNCIDFSPVNEAANYTICNVTSMIRCQKSLSEAVVVGKKKGKYTLNPRGNEGKIIDVKIYVKTANEAAADFFAWFCPPSDKCCDWECCSSVEKQYEEFDPPDNGFVVFIHAMIIFAIIVISIPLLYLLRRCVMKKTDGVESQREEQQRQVEMQPLNPQNSQIPPGQDYPKQLRSNPDQANYGWNPKPSAPAM